MEIGKSVGLSALVRPSTKGEVNEEELFSALIEGQITKLKGEKGGEAFRSAIATFSRAMKRPDGRIQLEDVAVRSLQTLVEKKILTKSEADKIYSAAFDAAQLDTDKEHLYDSFGGPKDPTRAVSELEKGVKKAEDALRQIETDGVGTKRTLPSSTSSSSRVTPNKPSGVSGGAGSFLFKPISDGEGRAVVLVPLQFSGEKMTVELRTKDGKVLEKGRFISFGDTGDRAKFAFAKVGSDYPKDLIVRVGRGDGSMEQFAIADPTQRYGDRGRPVYTV